MLRATPVDPYKTDRKVYAVGARVMEVPLARPADGAVEARIARITQPNYRKPRRRMFRRLNYCAVPGYAPLCMDSNDPDTVDCAFRQRLLREVPKGDPQLLKEFEEFVGAYLTKNVPIVEPMEFEEWLESTSYSEARKQDLRNTYIEMRGAVPNRSQRRHVDAFVKTEYYPTWKHARMINSRSDAFKVWSGPRFKAIEKVVYSIPEFVKHIPVPERPARVRALMKPGWRCFATDFTAFESHFVPELLRICECQLYKHCLRNDRDIDILTKTLMGKNEMRTRSGLRASVRGRRMSGDMCTSLGNGFTNLMLAKFIAHKKGGSITGFVEGDDGLFVTDIELTAKDYEKLGFTIKIEEVDNPCKASFCGMVFSESGEIIRDPRRFVMGFGWTHSFISAGHKIMDELLRAKALSTVYETPQCPIVGAFARYALEKTRHVNPRFVNDGYHHCPDEVSVPAFSPSRDTRLLFEEKYGISIECQEAIESAVLSGDFEKVAILMPPTAEQGNYAATYVEIS